MRFFVYKVDIMTHFLLQSLYLLAALIGCSDAALVRGFDYPIDERNVNQPSLAGIIPIHAATLERNIEGLQALLTIPDIEVNQADRFGWNPLHFAAMGGDLNSVTALLADGRVLVNQLDNDGWTALHYAALFGRLGPVAALVLAPGIDLDKQTSDGMTALHFAALQGHSDVVNALLDAHADAKLVNSDGQTAFEVATPECKQRFEIPRVHLLW